MSPEYMKNVVQTLSSLLGEKILLKAKLCKWTKKLTLRPNILSCTVSQRWRVDWFLFNFCITDIAELMTESWSWKNNMRRLVTSILESFSVSLLRGSWLAHS